MADDRYNRWQGQAIAQLSVAVALISGLSVSSLAVGFSLLQNKEFVPFGAFKLMFAWSFPFLLLAALFSCIAVVSRLLDFRLTARKVRKQEYTGYSRPLIIFWLGADEYGHITWFLFLEWLYNLSHWGNFPFRFHRCNIWESILAIGPRMN